MSVESLLKKQSYTPEDLREIMELLRAENGCPWDRELDHKSIRNNFIEEVYEVIEGIDTDNDDIIKEELGDVLLQVVFHARIAEEAGKYNLDDVADGICKKLIIRHPHVFSDVTVNSTEEVLSNWDDIKRQTKSQETQSVAMAAIPKTFPALMKAQKVQKKAKKAGFDWPDAEGAFNKVLEETEELKEVFNSDNKDRIEDELGDLLFSVVNVARFCDCNAESALERATMKFMRRYTEVERLAEEKNIDMKTSSIETLDKLWESVKMLEK
jgi:tetrapyrrole methylase family protein/MazG family protein